MSKFVTVKLTPGDLFAAWSELGGRKSTLGARDALAPHAAPYAAAEKRWRHNTTQDLKSLQLALVGRRTGNEDLLDSITAALQLREGI